MSKKDSIDPNNTFIISDTHFDHTNIISYCNRPFLTVEDMNETMIENWNLVVKENQTVFHLGDFGYGKNFNPKRGIEILERLNGNIVLICGSHDKKFPYWKTKTYRKNTIVEQWFGDTFVVMSHVPLLSWERRTHGAVCLFGHVHSGCRTKTFLCQNNSYDVGVDANDFKPILVSEAIKEARNTIGKLNIFDEYDNFVELKKGEENERKD